MASIGERLQNFHPVRKVVYFFVGLFSYPGLAIVNKLKISGTEHLKEFPKKKVLFVSNHQTYFADVITFLHIFCAVKWGKTNRFGYSLLFAQSFYQSKLCGCGRNDEREFYQSAFFIGRWFNCKTNMEDGY